MNKKILSGIIVITVLMIFVLGCNSKYEQPEEETGLVQGELSDEPAPADIVEKRGQKTNITEFNKLQLRASAIESFKFNLTDSGLNLEGRRYYVKGRFVKVFLPELLKHEDDVVYDLVYLDRKTKTAVSRCGTDNCPKPGIDKEVEKVEYGDYYAQDPMEYLYKVTHAEYREDSMISNQYVKVFDAKFKGDTARVWLQEYYGFPLKILVKEDDGSKRTIIFDDVQVGNVRSGEVELPFNFTVQGEKGNWYMWQHYLGEWPPEGQKTITELEPMYRT